MEQKQKKKKRILSNLFLTAVLAALFSGNARWTWGALEVLAAGQEAEHEDLQELYSEEDSRGAVKEQKSESILL